MFSDDENVVRLVSQVMPLVASFQVNRILRTTYKAEFRYRLQMVLLDHAAACCVDKVNTGVILIDLSLTKTIGRQHLGALFNLVAYYVLALPMGITLAFHPRTHLGLQGLWIGSSHGDIFVAFL
jgi:multidrug resistance protein, MATE family